MATPDYFENEYYQNIKRQINDISSAQQAIKEADDKYDKDETSTRFEVAYSYLAAGDYFSSNEVGYYEKSSLLFHYSGHHFRKLEEWRKAGNAYSKGGNFAEIAAEIELKKNNKEKAKEILAWGIRSYARAKNCYSDVGDADEAGQSYAKEQNTRKKLARIERKYMLWFTLGFWSLTSKYGESLIRWFICVMILIICFGVTYEILYSKGFVSCKEGEWSRGLSGIYHSFVTTSTLGFGHIYPKGFWAQLVTIINVFFGYIFLGTGVAIIARRVKSR